MTSISSKINYTQILGEDAKPTSDLPEFAKQSQCLFDLYKSMVLTRLFDKKAISLQRTGKMGTYPSSLGQEAIATAMGYSMLPEDVLVPYYREYAAQFLRGVSMQEMFLYWGGDERGMDYQVPTKDMPISVPISTQSSHAVGIAYAIKLRQQKRVVVCVCGDGATSKGDFYESLNAAGVWQLPVVFVVNNNQWAISVRREDQTSAQTIAQKSIAAGFVGEQVDGNDVIATKWCIQQAIDKARAGQGPALIEALTYRHCDHTTADDASRYRDQAEVDDHWKKEPVGRLRTYMENQNLWDDQKEASLIKQCQEKIETAVNDYLQVSPQAAESMFDFMYEVLPHDLAEQRKYFLSYRQHKDA